MAINRADKPLLDALEITYPQYLVDVQAFRESVARFVSERSTH